MKNYMVYTPEAHIAITEVYAENGVVYLKFKKPKTQIYEVMTLDMNAIFIAKKTLNWINTARKHIKERN